MCDIAPDITNPLVNFPKICIIKSIPYKEYPKKVENSLDTNKICHSIFQHI